jgi:hypothetical protein
MYPLFIIINYFIKLFKMASNSQIECQHLIVDNYFCSKCGTLYYKGVRKYILKYKNKYLIIVIIIETSQILL